MVGLGSLLHRHGQRSKSRLRASSPEKVVCLALEGAPTWTPAVRDQLLYLANACATGKGRFVTGKHIRLVVELRALHPDLRSFYSELLGFIMVDLPKVDQHLLLDILQGDQEDPLLVRLALKQLFDQGKAQLAQQLEVALHVLQYRVDEHRIARALVGEDVSLYCLRVLSGPYE